MSGGRIRVAQSHRAGVAINNTGAAMLVDLRVTDTLTDGGADAKGNGVMLEAGSAAEFERLEIQASAVDGLRVLDIESSIDARDLNVSDSGNDGVLIASSAVSFDRFQLTQARVAGLHLLQPREVALSSGTIRGNPVGTLIAGEIDPRLVLKGIKYEENQENILLETD